MRFLAFATDYDGTLAEDGIVPEATVRALAALRASGRKLIMVTGRTLPDLLDAYPHLDGFDLVIAENGGVLYRPGTGEQQLLTEAVPAALPEELERRAVPTFAGETIVATYVSYEPEVREVLRDLRLSRDLILNKEALMILPAGVDKVSGLRAALEELGLTPGQTVAVGDAENDIGMLRLCGCGAAVNNALDTVKVAADLVLTGERGAGVVELIGYLLDDDLTAALASVR